MTEFPGLKVEGGPYTPPVSVQYTVRTVRVAQVSAVVFFFFGEQIFAKLGKAPPAVLGQMHDNKLATAGAIYGLDVLAQTGVAVPPEPRQSRAFTAIAMRCALSRALAHRGARPASRPSARSEVDQRFRDHVQRSHASFEAQDWPVSGSWRDRGEFKGDHGQGGWRCCRAHWCHSVERNTTAMVAPRTARRMARRTLRL